MHVHVIFLSFQMVPKLKRSNNLSGNIYIYIFVHMYIYLYLNIFIHTNVCVYTYTYIENIPSLGDVTAFKVNSVSNKYI